MTGPWTKLVDIYRGHRVHVYRKGHYIVFQFCYSEITMTETEWKMVKKELAEVLGQTKLSQMQVPLEEWA